MRQSPGVRYAIVRAVVRYDADLLYANNSYKILRLPETDSSSGRKPNADGR